MKRQETGIIRGQIVLPWLLVFVLPAALNSFAGDITIDGDMNVASNLHVQGALSVAHPATNANEVVRKTEMDAAISSVSFTNLTDVPAGLADGDDDTRWNGNADGLNPSAGRDSLGLGSAAIMSADAFAPTNLAGYAGNNLTYSNNQFHASPGYGDAEAVAAVSEEWPNLDTDGSDDTQWDGGANGLNAAQGRLSLGLGSAATNDAGDFALTNEAVDYQTMRDYVGEVTFSGSFNDLMDVPAGLADGDDDTRWNGGADPEFNPAAGRTSLGLGSAAIMSANAFAPANLAAYAGNNLTYSSNKFHALPGYGDAQTVAAVANAWPKLDMDSTDDTTWDGGANGLDAAAGRTSLGLGTAATRDAIAFAPSDLAPYAGNNVTYSNGQFHAGIDITSFIMPPQGNLSMGVYTNMPTM